MRLHHAGLVQLCLLSRMDQHCIASMGDSLVRKVEVVMLYFHMVLINISPEATWIFGQSVLGLY